MYVRHTEITARWANAGARWAHRATPPPSQRSDARGQSLTKPSYSKKDAAQTSTPLSRAGTERPMMRITSQNYNSTPMEEFSDIGCEASCYWLISGTIGDLLGYLFI